MEDFTTFIQRIKDQFYLKHGKDHVKVFMQQKGWLGTGIETDIFVKQENGDTWKLFIAKEKYSFVKV
jgi:hypothetical protein